jgi:proteic killer suppression protein
MRRPIPTIETAKLSRTWRGQWAMDVNARWRICFLFRRGDAHDVEIVDHHRG